MRRLLSRHYHPLRAFLDHQPISFFETKAWQRATFHTTTSRPRETVGGSKTPDDKMNTQLTLQFAPPVRVLLPVQCRPFSPRSYAGGANWGANRSTQ